MPLLDLSRQIKNTDDIVFAGKDSAEMRWTKDASYSGSISGDFSDGSNDRIKVTMAGHGLTSLFNNDNEVIKINFPDNGNYSNFTPGEYVVYSIPHDDHLLLNNDTDGDGLDWAENLSGEGNGETWEYNRSASRLSITGDGTNDVFYVDSLQGRVFIGGSLDLAGQTAILDVAQVQLEDAILDLNFVDGAPNTLAYGGQGGFQIGDSLNTGVNAPQWLFNKGSDGSFEESFWHARYQNKDAGR